MRKALLEKEMFCIEKFCIKQKFVIYKVEFSARSIADFSLLIQENVFIELVLIFQVFFFRDSIILIDRTRFPPSDIFVCVTSLLAYNEFPFVILIISLSIYITGYTRM